jgi:hypothetical protein
MRKSTLIILLMVIVSVCEMFVAGAAILSQLTIRNGDYPRPGWRKKAPGWGLTARFSTLLVTVVVMMVLAGSHLAQTPRHGSQISALQNFSLAILSPKQTQLAQSNSNKQCGKDGDRFPPFFPLILIVIGGVSFCLFSYWL